VAFAGELAKSTDATIAKMQAPKTSGLPNERFMFTPFDTD
jgi:hypothetical protein